MNKVERRIQDLEEVNNSERVVQKLKNDNLDLEAFQRKVNSEFEMLEVNYRRTKQRLLQERRLYSEEMQKNIVEVQVHLDKISNLKNKIEYIKENEK